MRISLFLLTAVLASSASGATYKLDPEHSSVMFKVRHLVGHVTGQFDKFDGTFDYDPKDPKTWKASAEIDAASVDTKTAARDKHLRSEDFFDVEKHPKLTFVSTKIGNVKGNHAKLWGNLTILDTTKKIALDLEIGGVAKDSAGSERAAFTATGRINRKDFGLTWNDTVETGGVLVGDDVDITIEVEGIRQK